MSLASLDMFDTGPLANPLLSFGWLVASLPAFRTWTSTSSSIAAAERLFIFEPPRPTEDGKFTKEQLIALRPFGVLLYSDAGSKTNAPHRATRQGQATFNFGGRMLLILESNVKDEDTTNASEAYLKFLGHVGRIEKDLLNRHGHTDYTVPASMNEEPRGLFINQLWYPEGPANRNIDATVETLGDFFFTTMEVDQGM